MSKTANRWNAANVFYIIASVCLGTYVLSIGSSILIPIVVAGLVWFALVSIARLFQQIGPSFTGKPLLSHILAWVTLLFSAWLIVSVIGSTFAEFIAEIPEYEKRLGTLAANLTVWVGQQIDGLNGLISGQLEINLNQPQTDPNAAGKYAGQIQGLVENTIEAFRAYLPQAAGSLLSATQSSIVLVSTVLIYLIFFYSESSSFPKKLAALNREEVDQQRWSLLIGFIISRLASYIRIKTLTSVLTGGLGFALMAILNVNFAIVFALLLFLLNYVPVVGSLISSLLPIIFFLVDPNFSVGSWFILVIGLLVIQQGIGSVLEPRLLANSFNISSILVMASLLFWSALWGVFGMLISAPIMAAIVILLANFRGSRQLAILASADGNIDSLRPGA